MQMQVSGSWSLIQLSRVPVTRAARASTIAHHCHSAYTTPCFLRDMSAHHSSLLYAKWNPFKKICVILQSSVGYQPFVCPPTASCSQCSVSLIQCWQCSGLISGNTRGINSDTRQGDARQPSSGIRAGWRLQYYSFKQGLRRREITPTQRS